MGDTIGILPYERGRACDFTAGTNANTYTQLSNNIIPYTSMFSGAYGGGSKLATLLYNSNGIYSAGYVRDCFIIATPKCPQGMWVLFMSPYTGASVQLAISAYGSGTLKTAQFGIVTEYTTNTITIAKKVNITLTKSTQFKMEVHPNLPNHYIEPYCSNPINVLDILAGVSNWKFGVFYAPL